MKKKPRPYNPNKLPKKAGFLVCDKCDGSGECGGDNACDGSGYKPIHSNRVQTPVRSTWDILLFSPHTEPGPLD